jgi:hypothetical protein
MMLAEFGSRPPNAGANPGSARVPINAMMRVLTTAIESVARIENVPVPQPGPVSVKGSADGVRVVGVRGVPSGGPKVRKSPVLGSSTSAVVRLNAVAS